MREGKRDTVEERERERERGGGEGEFEGEKRRGETVSVEE